MRVLIRDVFLSSPSFIILVFSTKIFFHVDRFYCSVPMVIPYFRDWLRIDPYISSKKRNNISCLVAYSVNTKSDCGMLVFQKWLVYLAIEMRTNRFFSHHPPTIYSFTRCRVPPFYLFRKSYPAVLFQLTGTGVHGGHLENEKLCPADCNVFPRLFHYPSCIVLSINFLWLSLLDWRAQNTAVLGTQMAGKYVENTDGIW